MLFRSGMLRAEALVDQTLDVLNLVSGIHQRLFEAFELMGDFGVGAWPRLPKNSDRKLQALLCSP